MLESITITEYLFTRLHQLGIEGLHGVPGDFNLKALDYVNKCGLKWVGSANELNAGMALLERSQGFSLIQEKATLLMVTRVSRTLALL